MTKWSFGRPFNQTVVQIHLPKLYSILYTDYEFENERAVLLPDVSNIFLTQYLASDSNPENEYTLESPEIFF